VRAYRELRPHLTSYLSSFGRPSLHAGLDWQAWADGGHPALPVGRLVQSVHDVPRLHFNVFHHATATAAELAALAAVD
jgi:hypothetical protein